MYKFISDDDKITILEPIVVLPRLQVDNASVQFRLKNGKWVPTHPSIIFCEEETNFDMVIPVPTELHKLRESKTLNVIYSGRHKEGSFMQFPGEELHLQRNTPVDTERDHLQVLPVRTLKSLPKEIPVENVEMSLNCSAHKEFNRRNIVEKSVGISASMNGNSTFVRNSKTLYRVPEKLNLQEERRHKCVKCGDSFYTHILLAVHKRIHEQGSFYEHIFEKNPLSGVQTDKERRSNGLEGVCSAASDAKELNHLENHGQVDDKESVNICRQRPLSQTKSSKSKKPRILQHKKEKLNETVHFHHEKRLSVRSTAEHENAGWKQQSQQKKSNVSQQLLTKLRESAQIKRPQKVKRLVITPCVRDHDYIGSISLMRSPVSNSNSTCTKVGGRNNQNRRGKRSKNTLLISLLRCPECPATFSQDWYLELHMILLHLRNDESKPIRCPGCLVNCAKEETLRVHVERGHPSDLNVMNNEISSSLGLSTDSLTGEHIRHAKRKESPESQVPEKSRVSNISVPSLACDWNIAPSSKKDIILDLVEAELRYIVTERNKVGDHFSTSDLQRLAMQISDSLHISHFFGGKPPKRWAQKILMQVRQIPRPGRYRFVHNMNFSYLKAVDVLADRGLSENKIFYAFDARLCHVKDNGTVKMVTKTPVGATSPDVTLEDTVCTVICTNAEGSVILHPTIIFRNQIIDTRHNYKVKPTQSSYPSKDLVENVYFHEWFAQFLLSIPPARPVLLLVEGQVSQLSYSTILMGRENDVYIVFLPSRKRFVHSHQLIRESMLAPLMEELDKELVKYLETRKKSTLHLEQFGQIFKPAWEIAAKKALIIPSFVQAGFLPIPTSLEPLEEAERDFLQEVLGGRDRGQEESENSGLASPVSINPDLPPSPASPRPPTEEQSVMMTTVASDPGAGCDSDCASFISVTEIKEEPMEYKTLETDTSINIQIKDELIELDGIKEEPEEQDSLRGNQSFNSTDILTKHSGDQDEDGPDFFSCPICSAEFKEEDDLLKHRCKAQTMSAYNCDLHTCHICSMSFALEDTLSFHMTMHKNNLRLVPPKETSLRTYPGSKQGVIAIDPRQRMYTTSCSQSSPNPALPSTNSCALSRKQTLRELEDEVELKHQAKKRLYESETTCAMSTTPPKVCKQVTFTIRPKYKESPHFPELSATLSTTPSDIIWSKKHEIKEENLELSEPHEDPFSSPLDHDLP